MRRYSKRFGSKIKSNKNVSSNERQRKALQYVLEKGFITNRSYQELNGVGKKTAYLELSDLIKKGLLSSTGKGRSVKYAARF